MTDEIIPSGALHLQTLHNKAFITSQYQTLSCVAFGNPRPDVALFKDLGSSVQKLLPEVEYSSHKYSKHKDYTLLANDSGVEGKYYCRYKNT